MDQPSTSTCNLYMRSDLTSFLTKLLEYMKDGSFCDVTLKVGNKKISAHRVILAATIPYFETMFQSDFRDSKKETIEIQGIDPDVLESLISLSYGQGIELNIENAESLLYGADFLRLAEVKSDFEDFLKKNLDSRNVLRAKKAGERFNRLSMVRVAQNFIDNNFSDFIQSDDFLELESHELISIIRRDELKSSEEKVYEAVLKWVKYAILDRASFLPEVLSNVRMCLLSPVFLYDIVRSETLIQTNPQCKSLLEEATNYHMMSAFRKLPENIQNRPRNSSSRIYAFGGVGESGEILSDLNTYDPQKDEWTTEGNTINVTSAASAVFDGKLYLFVTETDVEDASSSVQIFDMKTKQISEGEVMEYSGESMAAATLNDCIYVTGGKRAVRCLDTAYCYSPKDNSWTKLASLNIKRNAHGSVSLDGEVYVIGGMGRFKKAIHTCEKYYPQQDTWSLITPMLTPRAFAGVAVIDGKIFVCGGKPNENDSTNSVEVYDPSTDEWSYVAPMNERRAEFTLISFKNKLYAIGGFDWIEDKVLSSCEVYDLEEDTWSFVASLPEATYNMIGCSSIS